MKSKIELDDEGNPSKNSKQLRKFVLYCLENPDQRFWQALRNWDNSAFIFRQKRNEQGMTQQIEDTFYED